MTEAALTDGAMTRRGLLGAGAALGAGLYLPSWSWAGAQSVAGIGGTHAAVAGLGRRGRPGHRRGHRARRGAGGQRAAARLDQELASRCPPACPADLRDFIEHARQLPAWADTAQAQGGGGRSTRSAAPTSASPTASSAA